MKLQFPGRFVLLAAAHAADTVLLRREAREGDPAVDIFFAGVTQHDLPATLNGIAVREYGLTEREWLVSSAGRDYRVRARSLQVHEGTLIYGRALPLAHCARAQRMSWMVLLWSLRFAWGRALVRWIRSR